MADDTIDFLGEKERREDAKKAKPAPLTPSDSATIAAWAAARPWFSIDVELHYYAQGVEHKLMHERPELSVLERLAEVERTVRARFPERFAS